MLLFCDESGDPGMPGQSGVSSYFAVGIICCRDGEEAARLATAQERLRVDLGWRGEFKWSKMPIEVRMGYLTGIVSVLGSYRVAIWDKQRVVLRSGFRPEVEVMRACLESFDPMETADRLIIDGERDGRRSSEIRTALGVREVRMEKSHACPQLQMADMLVGFHAYAYRKGWRKIPKGLHHLEANLRWCS
jgi:hypothetical protein